MGKTKKGIKKVKVNGVEIIIPDYYQQVDSVPEDPENSIPFATHTDHARCFVLITSVDYSKSLPRTQEDLIDGIREYLNDKQGFIKVETGNDYVYSIIKNLKEPSGVQYTLTYQKFCKDFIINIQGFFEEAGMTGFRDSTVFSILKNENIFGNDEDPFMGWAQDPYDESITSGARMNLSEKEEFDEKFPEFPLPLCREFINTVVDKKDPGINADKLKKGVKDILSLMASKTADVATVGSEFARQGFDVAKSGAGVAGDSIAKAADNVVKTGKEAQMAVLRYVDKKKNAKFFETKLRSFEDGIKEGKIEAVDYIKKYANFCLAATAVSYYFARCDGDVSEEEQLEIQFDLDSIIKNKDLPQEIKNKMSEISLNQNLQFEEVAGYLDGVGDDTVLEFQKDIDEIIFADGVVTDAEKEAKAKFNEYLKKRMEAHKHE